MNKEIFNYFKANSYKEIGKTIIIDNRYVLKKDINYDHSIYNYLVNKDFKYIISCTKYKKYDLFPYIEDEDIPTDEKASRLVSILSILHNKTTYYREVNLDNIKKIYEDLNGKIDYLNKYYLELQDVIEQKIYYSPAEYLLMNNISIIYSALDFAKNCIDEWYSKKEKQKKERVVLLHNKPILNHLVGNKLISWNNYKRDIPIYDFIYFYKHNYMDLEMSSLYEIYQSRYKYSEEEKLLFMTFIAIPDKIVFTNNNYKNTEIVNKVITYVITTRDFILNEDNKSNESNKDKF